MKKLLQINSALNSGSTGRIAEDIGCLARRAGWETYIGHGARHVSSSAMIPLGIGSLFHEYLHYGKGLLFDNHGLESISATKKFLKEVETIQPDVVHLHNIHGYYLNYPLLFQYLKEKQIPVVWTLHDCWSFTGHCAYYISEGCEKWKQPDGCHDCVLHSGYPKSWVDRSHRNFQLKKKVFTSLSNVTLVSVSQWLKSQVDESFLQGYNGQVIYNGVDTHVFSPKENNIKQKLGLEGKKLLIGVATSWGERKGLFDYYRLAETLPDDYQILLIGLSAKQLSELPSKVKGITRTNNVDELAQYYSAADIVMNLSYAETFGMTTVEGFACGTPSIVYNATASPELISPDTGIVVEPGNMEQVKEAVLRICERGKDYYAANCRKRAVEKFDKNRCFKQYVDLYDKLLLK